MLSKLVRPLCLCLALLVNQKQVYVNLTSSTIKEGQELGLAAIVTLNDVTKEKEFEGIKLDFVSMAAYELRTTLTSVRGLFIRVD